MIAAALSHRQAEAQRDLESKRALFTEAVKIRQIEKQQEIRVQEAEFQRRERELIVTMLKQRRLTYPLDPESEGRSSAIQAQGEVGADRGRYHVSKGRSGTQSDERESRGVPGVESVSRGQ